MINEPDELRYDTMRCNKSDNYPICNELLFSDSDITKNIYNKMLGVVLRQGDEIIDSQWAIFKRIIAGANADFEAIEYLRMAKQFDENDLQKFIELCSETPLKYRFILDSMVLSSLSQNPDNQYKLIIAFCEVFKIEKNEVKFLSSMAKAIVEMDLLLYVDASYCKPFEIEDKVFYGYFLILQSYLKNEKNITILQGFDFIKDPVNVFEESQKADKLAIINIDLSPITTSTMPFSIKNKTMLLLSGCTMKGSREPVSIEGCQNVKLLNMTIADFQNRTLCIEKVDTMLIKNCLFENCNYTFHFDLFSYRGSFEDYAGGVIYSKEKHNGVVIIDDCRFISCGTDILGFPKISPCISNIKCDVRNSVFLNCYSRIHPEFEQGKFEQHYKEILKILEKRDIRLKKPFMFSEDSKECNCTIVNSPMFNNYSDTNMG